MSDFQIALAGIAILVTLAVMAYNRWQETKYRKRAERAFNTDHPDVLFGGEPARVEPRIGELPGGGFTDDVEEGLLSPIVSEPVVPKSAGGAGVPAINAEIDTIALVLADAPMLPDQFWPTIQQSRRLSKHILWEGLVNGIWQPIPDDVDDDQGFREIRAGLQLASREGPIDGDAVQAFSDMMAAFADAANAVSQREDVATAIRRSRSVDAFCADTDIEIAVNIIGRNGVTFASVKVREVAESLGLALLPSGEYALQDELARPLFTLRNMNAGEPPGIRQSGAYLTGLSLALDVPRTDDPDKIFERMMAMAMKLADALTGEIVDDNRKLLTANGRKVIGETIVDIVHRMEERGVLPGSAVALRLYS